MLKWLILHFHQIRTSHQINHLYPNIFFHLNQFIHLIINHLYFFTLYFHFMDQLNLNIHHHFKILIFINIFAPLIFCLVKISISLKFLSTFKTYFFCSHYFLTYQINYFS